MTFKREWEKFSEYTVISDRDIRAIVAHALPTRTLGSYQILAGGCANLNIKLSFADQQDPYALILRLYFRDKQAVYREQKIAELIHTTVPVAQFYVVDDFEHYRYALVEYIEGISLCDLLLDHPKVPIGDIMHAVGTTLVAIQKYRFERPGFFDANLNVRDPFSAADLIDFIYGRLTHPSVIAQLEVSTLDAISRLIERYREYFPGDMTHLVHADYDPANILVRKIDGKWQIAAVLDWEFAFSGPWLCDVANMVRYAHEMPPLFEEAFLKGITDAGLVLPEHWRIAVDLLNLVSLIDSLAHGDPIQRPRQRDDIMKLIQHIIKRLRP